MVDMKSLVTFHERAVRTAELVGIELPRGRSKTERSEYDEESESESSEDENE